MEKRYQVFVSSTYADLMEERRHVIQALMEMDCIPAGMEIFPAADEEQWNFIRKVIDDCDYYLLIIGGRYGSLSSSGISYTEKEFDYAVSIGLKVVALIHEDPNEIPFGKSESDPSLREKLTNFKDKVCADRLVKFWKEPRELPGLVALSLSKTIKTYPAVGWVRADKISSSDALGELNQLRKQLSEYQLKVEELEDRGAVIGHIAELDEFFVVHGETKVQRYEGTRKRNWEVKISCAEIFSLLSPYLLEHPNETAVKLNLAKCLALKAGHDGYNNSIDDQEFKTIGVQLQAYGLINRRYTSTIQGGMALFWTLTKSGEREMLELRTVKKGPEPFQA